MKKIVIAAVLLFASIGYCFPQSKIDSLKRVVAIITDEQEKARALVMLGKIYFQMDLNEAMKYIDQSIVISRKNQFEKSLADAYNVKGILFINLGRHADAISFLDSAATLHSAADNKTGMASVYGNLGALYFTIGDYNKSMEYQAKCLEADEALNNKKGIALALEGIANIYFVQKYFDKAILWYGKAYAIHKEIKDKAGEIPALVNIAMALCELKNYEEALQYYNKSLLLADSLNSKDDIATAYFGMGQLYYAKHDHERSLEYFSKSKQIFDSVGNVYRSIEIEGHLAEIYFDKKDFARSIAYNEEFLTRGRSIGAKQYERDALKGLHKCYAALKQYDKAYECQSQYILLNDSILNEEKIKQIAAMQTRFETEKKEAENSLLMQQNRIQAYELNRSILLIFGLAGLLIISAGIALLIIRNFRMKTKQRTMLLEQKLLRAQMNPHFIFNSLIAIESFIYKNEPKEAGRYLSGFAKLVRNILENSREEYVTLGKEINTLEHYLELQKLRYDEHFDYTIDIDKEIDPENIAIPPMLAQPFIENSIEHGIKNINIKGKIDIRFSIRNHHILFEVKDNGIGIETSVAMKHDAETHHSLATMITKERLFILNRRKSKKIKFAINELKDSLNNVLGTQVSFSIPYKGI